MESRTPTDDPMDLDNNPKANQELQAAKPLTIEEPKEIADLRVLYIANTRKYAACFMGIRPFEGFGLPGDGLIVKSKRDSTTYHDSNTGSNGIDIMLVVLRQHLSFHPELCVPQDQITDEETEVYKVAWMNLGENKIQDWDIKRKLFKSIHGISVLHFDDFLEKKFSFEDVLAHPKLQNLFRGDHFGIASHIMLRKYADDPDSVKMTRAIADPDSLRLFNELRWDGVMELDAFIDRHFKTVIYGNERRRFFAAKPWFFNVLYEPQMIMRSISELRNFEMGGIATRELKDTGGIVIHNTEKHVYALCAVVRLGNGNNIQDDVRTYHPNGREVTPLGEPKEFVAKAEYKKLGKRWSIKDGGRYMLFYVRITPRETPLAEDFFDEDAPEFEPRYHWDTSDVDMTDGNQQNRSALKKTSVSSIQTSSDNGQLGIRPELPKFGPLMDGGVTMLASVSSMPMFGRRSDSALPNFGSAPQALMLGSATQAPKHGSASQGPKHGSNTQASGHKSGSQESSIDARNSPKNPSTSPAGRPYISRVPKKRVQDELMYDDTDYVGNNDAPISTTSDARSSSRPRKGEYCNFCRKSGHDEGDCYKKNPAPSSTRGTLNRRGNHSQRRGRGSSSGEFGSANEGVRSSTDQNRRDQGPGSGGHASDRGGSGSNHGDRGRDSGRYRSNRNYNPGRGSGGGYTGGY
ncbi:hypothetical protein EAE99_009968 [Botrytis elliptica]|nr:hypothetical protein EAE99_009968 [Botrytis elliptica]